jgi:acyl carrier protein
MNDVEGRIAAFLREHHPSASGGVDAIFGSTDLFADGWLDSLLQLQLLDFLETEFGLRVSPFRVARRAFRSVSAIATLVAGGAP